MWIINTWPLCVCICVCVCVPDKHPADPHVIYADVRTHTAGTDEPVWMKHDFFPVKQQMCSTTTHSVVTLPLYAVYWAPVFWTSCADPCTLSGFSASSCLWPLRWVLWGCSYVTDSVSQRSVKWQTCTNCSTSRDILFSANMKTILAHVSTYQTPGSISPGRESAWTVLRTFLGQ